MLRQATNAALCRSVATHDEFCAYAALAEELGHDVVALTAIVRRRPRERPAHDQRVLPGRATVLAAVR
jgi:hypothetical protein